MAEAKKKPGDVTQPCEMCKGVPEFGTWYGDKRYCQSCVRRAVNSHKALAKACEAIVLSWDQGRNSGQQYSEAVRLARAARAAGEADGGLMTHSA